MQLVNSQSLNEKRLGVAKLPRVDFHTSTQHPEGNSYSYFFSENNASSFYLLYGESIYNYKLKNGYVTLIWEGKQNYNKQPKAADPLAVYLGTAIDTVWGERQSVKSRMVFFNDDIIPYGKGDYGIIDTNGKVLAKHEVEASQVEDIFQLIPEEGK